MRNTLESVLRFRRDLGKLFDKGNYKLLLDAGSVITNDFELTLKITYRTYAGRKNKYVFKYLPLLPAGVFISGACIRKAVDITDFYSSHTTTFTQALPKDNWGNVLLDYQPMGTPLRHITYRLSAFVEHEWLVFTRIGIINPIPSVEYYAIKDHLYDYYMRDMKLRLAVPKKSAFYKIIRCE